MSAAPPHCTFLKHQLRSPHHLLKCNRLLDTLSKTGRISDAQRLFDEMPQRDEVSWNTLISSYARSGRFSHALHLLHTSPHLHSSSIPWSSLISAFSRHARSPDSLRLFRQMLAFNLPPDPYSLGAFLRAASNLSSIVSGRLAHSIAVKSSLDADAFVAAALVDMYSKCGEFDIAAAVFAFFSTEHRPNRVLWTAAVTACAENGDYFGAMDCFRRMRIEGLLPNQFTLPSVFLACAAEFAIGFGRQVHALAIRIGLDGSSFIQSTLVSLYGKCSDFAGAMKVLDSSVYNDPVSWNSFIVICSRAALHQDALYLFVEMRHRDITMDEFTYPSALNSVAAAASDNAGNGSSLHCLVFKSGFINHQHVGNALVDMYAKVGRPEAALKVFDDLPLKNVVGWTALYNGFARHVCYESALQLYGRMRSEAIAPDEFVLSGVLSSCGELALLETGRQVHALAARLGLDSFRSVGNALVTMYAKSGCADEAHCVFASMRSRDAITWTAMIIGYAQNGRGRDSVPLFDYMLRSGLRPDYVTFIGVLFACSHAGLVELGRAHFDSMERVYGLSPGPEHYACMVDLLGRAGRLSEAATMVAQAGPAADAMVWKALLGACRVHRNIHAAERAADEILRLDPGDAATYVMLSNVYSWAGRWSEVARVRGMMKARGVSKEPGCSWVEEGGRVHVFYAEDNRHVLAAEIYKKVAEMMGRAKGAGYVADTRWALQDGPEEEREMGLAHHSEKLAVAFGLMGGPDGKPIRVFKNLRVCGDCHNALKVVAKVYMREIILRDTNCFHHFNDGNCSCFDYW